MLFQKTFLCLWLLTAAFCTGQPDYDQGVFQLRPDDVQLGSTVTITGKKQPGNFVIDLLYTDYKTLPLSLSCYQDSKVTLNSRSNDVWGEELTAWATIVQDVEFAIEFTFLEQDISIKMNGSRLTDFQHRMPFDKITAIGVKDKFTPNCIFGATQVCATMLGNN